MSQKDKLEERQFLLEIIEMYKTLPALWDVKNVAYANKLIKNEQYEILLTKYKERYPNANKKDLANKLNTLRTNFRKELARIENSQKSGAGADEVCEPTLWYYEEMQFLAKLEKPASSKSSFNAEGDENENLELSEKNEVKKKRKKDETDELLELAKKRLAKPQKDSEKISITWGMELDKMSSEQQLYAKKAINDILFEGQMGTLNRTSVQINKPVCTHIDNPNSNQVVYYYQTPSDDMLHNHKISASQYFSNFQ